MSDHELIFYDDQGARYQPVKHANRATGRSAYRVKPPGASNKTEDFLEVDTVEEVAKAMLVDGLPARVKAFSGGPVNVLRFGADLLARYELNPLIAGRLGIPAHGGREAATAGSRELEQLRQRFLAVYPNFEEAGAFAATSGAYHDTYRSRVDALLTAVATHPGDGWAVLQDVLTASQSGRGSVPPFLDGDVNWRTPRARDADPVTFDSALDALTQGMDDPPAATVAFNTVFWPALNAIGDTTTFRDTRVVPSTVLAAIAPDRAISVRYQLYSNAERLLNGRSLFANKPMTADEYRAVLALAEQIRVTLTRWGWEPRDLWDVHGFILATCADRNLDLNANVDAGTPAKDIAMPEPTNLILYGPPGTGKTYATAAHAVRLCGEGSPEDRKALMARYKALSDAGRIEFVTFHQSLAYEDFVEGLRPVQGGDGAAGFELQPTPGIFRRIARRAETSTGPGDAIFTIGERQVFKMSIGEAANPDDAHLYEDAIAGGYTVLGFSDIDWSDDRFADRQAIIDAIHAEDGNTEADAGSGRVQMPNIFRNWMKPGDLVIVSKGNGLFRAIGEITGGYEHAPREGGGYAHRRAVRWLWTDRAGVPVNEIYARGFSMRSAYLLAKADLNIPALERYVASQQDAGSGATEPFVLVIDEINRANISKVFGELITLLEADKRLGAANELKVRLPYSGDLFGVPANLNIIGTMNTADRSIALIDKALRRRFTFTEMMPDYSVEGMEDDVAGSGVSLADVLRTMNDRIEYLLDREHQIGHGWLLGCGTKEKLDATMRTRVIPLIAEYFFEDWGRTADVLGGRENNPFLEANTLVPPPGMTGEEPRIRWSVRTSFAEDTYTRLVTGN